MSLDKTHAPRNLARLFEGSRALSRDEQLRDILKACERYDIMAFAKMVCLKHSGHQDILQLTPAESRLFIGDIDLFLTAVISLGIRKQ